MLVDRNGESGRWAEYIEDLFKDDRDKQATEMRIDSPSIMKEEVREAIKKINLGMAAGPDNITVEALDAIM